jgi:YidC/Oxa1 family membrane protein insertase
MDNLRIFFIFGLLIVSLSLWEAWQNDYVRPQQEADELAQVNDAEFTQNDSVVSGKDLPDVPAAKAVVDTGKAMMVNASSSTRIHVKTDVIDVFINTRGGDIESLALLDYPVDSSTPNVPVQFLTEQAKNKFIVQSGLRADGEAPTHYDVYTSQNDNYELSDSQDVISVPLTWTSKSGLVITKTYRFKRNSYLVEVDYQVDNKGTNTFTAYPYAQFNRVTPEEDSGFVYTYTGAVFSSPGEEYEKVKFGDLDDAPFERTTTKGWAAMIQHYFVAAIIPENDDQAIGLYGKSIDNQNYTAGVKMPTITAGAGDTVNTHYAMYIGPKEHQRLEAAAAHLPLTIDYGHLTIISEFLFMIMEWIHKITNNWGWSIVFLTVLIKLAFYKLSAASYRSMASMRKLTPKLAALKERHGDDKQKFNQAMMDLYRTEKINPLGGCLPILVQMPVFLAFYWVLVESIELRQAPFIFWLQDLTAMDPYFILPVLFGLSMFFQQKLNPPPQDPAQAMVMKAFPIVFTVFFAFFPSGLVLYWVVNNVLSIAQQWHITRKLGAL